MHTYKMMQHYAVQMLQMINLIPFVTTNSAKVTAFVYKNKQEKPRLKNWVNTEKYD